MVEIFCLIISGNRSWELGQGLGWDPDLAQDHGQDLGQDHEQDHGQVWMRAWTRWQDLGHALVQDIE